MSYSIDVNVLLFASDEESSLHGNAISFLEASATRPELLYLSWHTIMGYLRIATHPAIFTRPLTPAEANRNVDQLMALPNVRALAEGDRFWDVYRTMTRDLVVRGNLVPDAHLAALLLSNDVRTLYTNDRDFRKFDFLQIRDPFG